MITVLNSTLLAIYVVTSVAGLTLLKMGGLHLNYRSILGFILYGLGFALWFVMLARLPLSKAFPVAAGGLLIGTQFAGWLALGETLSPRHLAGVLLTGIGIIFVSLER